MATIRETLESLKARNPALMRGTQLVQKQAVEAEQRRAGSFEVQHVVAGAPVSGEEDAFFLVREEFPLEHLHGKLPLGDALKSDARHVAFSACDEELIDFDATKTLFVDTETIGLAGGTGTVAFLIGVGYFTEKHFVLEQCFLRDYNEEESMLQFIAERFAGCQTIVGYNSKSFDLPLLQTRFIQNRIRFHGGACMHYDLVHAVRRVWKRRIQDCSLKNVERELLGITRVGDVPSHLIGQYWFDYLRTRDARPLKGVFYHHKMDILSLVTLTAWLAQCLDQPQGDGFEHCEDRLSLVRLHFRHKQYEAVIEHGLRFLEVDERSELRRDCMDLLGQAYKKLKNWAGVCEILELCIQEFPSNTDAYVELAKVYEHKIKNFGRAEELCLAALERLGGPQTDLDSEDSSEHFEIASRIRRVRKKSKLDVPD